MAVLGVLIAVAGAIPLAESTRAVDVVITFAAAFGAGAALVAAIHEFRSSRSPRVAR